MRMEKRLAASAAGLRELAVLREKHQREVEELLASLSAGRNGEVRLTGVLGHNSAL